MNRYSTAVDLRRAIEARLKSEAESMGSDYGRLRRIVVFDRIAARLSFSSSANKSLSVLIFDRLSKPSCLR